jgi:hypothetical protein
MTTSPMPLTAPADWIHQLAVYAQQRSAKFNPVVADREEHETIKQYAFDFAQVNLRRPS